MCLERRTSLQDHQGQVAVESFVSCEFGGQKVAVTTDQSRGVNNFDQQHTALVDGQKDSPRLGFRV